MYDWIEDVPEKDRDKVRELYNKAKTFEDKVELLKTWHPGICRPCTKAI
jgi:hypothetical protein